MSNNKKVTLLLALVILVTASFGMYGFLSGKTVLVGWGLAVGVVVSIVDWVTRTPGKKPNPRVTAVAYALGILGAPLVAIMFGKAASDSLTFVVTGVLLPICLYLFIATFVAAHKSPGFWKR